MQSGDRYGQADLGQGNAQFCKRDVLARLPQGQDVSRSLLNPARSHITALGLGGKSPSLQTLRLPADRRRWRNTKASRRCPATHAAINRSQKPRAQIHRERVTHPCRPPSPARVLNQKSDRKGIPQRFTPIENRSKDQEGSCRKSWRRSGSVDRFNHFQISMPYKYHIGFRYYDLLITRLVNNLSDAGNSGAPESSG